MSDLVFLPPPPAGEGDETSHYLAYLADYALTLTDDGRASVRESVHPHLRSSYDAAMLARADMLETEKLQREERDRQREYERLKSVDEAKDRLKREKQEKRVAGDLTQSARAFMLKLEEGLKTPDDLDDIADPVPLVDGWIFQDSLTWIGGPSGTYKSFIANDLACRFGRADMDYHGLPMAHGEALYFVAEGGRGFKFRKKAWEHEHGAIENVLYYPAPIQLSDLDTAVPALIALARTRGFKLIIFDTQAMCTVGMDENTNEDMGVVINALHQLREATGACVLLVHHFGKDKASGLRGASAIYAAADTVLTVARKDATVRLSTRSPSGKQKDDEERDDLSFALKVAGPPGQKPSLVPVLDETWREREMRVLPEVSNRDVLILQGLADRMNVGGMGAADIAKFIQEKEEREGSRPWGRNNATSWMDKLVRNGTAEKRGAYYLPTEMGLEVLDDA